MGLLQWWYSRGWLDEVRRVGARLKGTAGFFSLGQLLSTLLAPYRQTSATAVSGSIGVQLHAFFDKLLSRFIGGIIRSMTIIAGAVVLVAQAVLGMVTVLIWLLVPLLPAIGAMMFAIGWTPGWI